MLANSFCEGGLDNCLADCVCVQQKTVPMRTMITKDSPSSPIPVPSAPRPSRSVAIHLMYLPRARTPTEPLLPCRVEGQMHPYIWMSVKGVAQIRKNLIVCWISGRCGYSAAYSKQLTPHTRGPAECTKKIKLGCRFFNVCYPRSIDLRRFRVLAS